MSFGSGRSTKSNPLRGAAGDKPKREVFPTSEIPHKWAHATQSRARNAQGNLFFDGDTIYSYRTSWPIARIYRKRGAGLKGASWSLTEKENKRALVLVNSDNYSNTTAGHTSQVARAVSHLTCVRVPHPVIESAARFGHRENLRYLTQESARELARAQRAMTGERVATYILRARKKIADATRYMDFFGIRRVRPVFPEDSAQAALARVKVIENPDPVRDAAKIKARERSAAKRRATLQSAFDQYCAEVARYNAAIVAAQRPDAAQVWRDTGQWPDAAEADRPYLTWAFQRKLEHAGFTLPRRYDGRPSEVLLRVTHDDSDGEQIVTSLGARVPLAAAPMAWNLVRRAMRTGGYKPSGLSRVTIGDYPLTDISADGTLRAGCHTIKFAELELLARTLGLTDTEENNV